MYIWHQSFKGWLLRTMHWLIAIKIELFSGYLIYPVDGVIQPLKNNCSQYSKIQTYPGISLLSFSNSNLTGKAYHEQLLASLFIKGNLKFTRVLDVSCANMQVMKQFQHNSNDNVYGCRNLSERSLEKRFINPTRCQVQKVCRTFSTCDQCSIFS